jgi:hypothetical protein
MGTYAILYCRETEQMIRPGDVSDGSCKLHHLAHRGDLGRLVLHLLAGSSVLRWPSVTLAHDGYPARLDEVDYETVRDLYEDVTAKAIDDYNDGREGAARLEYTGRSRR